jgi:ribosomal subunit interface protein
MQVVVRSRNLEVPVSLRTIAERKINRLERVAKDVSRAEVDFAEERNPRIAGRASCAVILHVRGGTITAHAAAPVPEAALDLALDKIRHQVGRRKERRVSSRLRRRFSARSR